MRIEQLDIYKFGQLEHVSLSLNSPITLFFGANEAGKSTILDFIRSTLFGFSHVAEQEKYMSFSGGASAGRLVVSNEAKEKIYVERLQTRKKPAIFDTWGRELSEEALQRLHHGISGEMFRHLFAFSLEELSQLRTLQSDEINAFMYAAGAGIRPAALLEAEQALQSQMNEMFRPRGQNREINQLLIQMEAQQQKLKEAKKKAADIESLQERQAELDRQLKELETQLEQDRRHREEVGLAVSLFEHWQRIKELKYEQHLLPNFTHFPEFALRRYENLQAEKTAVAEQLDQLDKLRRNDEEQLKKLEWDEQLVASKPELSKLFDEMYLYREWLQQLNRCELEEKQVSQERVQLLSEMGLESYPSSAYEPTLPSWGMRERERMLDINGRFESLLTKQTELEAEWEQLKTQQLREQQQMTRKAEEIRRKEEKLRTIRFADRSLQNVNHWKTKLQQLKALDQEWDRGGAVAVTRASAAEVQAPLWLSAIPICAALVAPVYFILQRDMLLAGIFALMWLAAAASIIFTRWYLAEKAKRRQRQKKGDRIEERLVTAWRSIGLSQHNSATILSRHPSWLSELERLVSMAEAEEQQLLQLRERLEDLRLNVRFYEEQLQQIGDRLSQVEEEERKLQQIWAQELEKLSLPSSGSPRKAHQLLGWADQLVAVEKQLMKILQQKDDLQQKKQLFEEKVHRWCPHKENLLEELYRLREKLQYEEKKKNEYELLQARSEEDKLKQSALQSKLDQFSREIIELWKEAAATNEEQFYSQVKQYEASQRLQAELQQRESMVWTSLNDDRNSPVIGLLETYSQHELEQLGHDMEHRISESGKRLDSLREQKGRLQQELEQRMKGSEIAELQWEFERMNASFQEALKEWTVRACALQMIQDSKRLYEQERQPEVIRLASEYFHTLTDGRYSQIFAPLGEQRFVVITRDGTRLEPSLLSRGTVEQLYLSLRFALIVAYRSKAVMPILMDDIMVNFDSQRMRRTLQLLDELSNHHQIILFTCHPHVAHATREICGEKVHQFHLSA